MIDPFITELSLYLGRIGGHLNWEEYTSERDSYKPLCTIHDIILVCLRVLRHEGSQQVVWNLFCVDVT